MILVVLLLLVILKVMSMLENEQSVQKTIRGSCVLLCVPFAGGRNVYAWGESLSAWSLDVIAGCGIMMLCVMSPSGWDDSLLCCLHI